MTRYLVMEAGGERYTAIYGLLDPRDKKIKYVGKSVEPRGRVVAHRNGTATNHCNANFRSWMSELKSADLWPRTLILEAVPLSAWEEAERKWIAYVRSIGHPLTNVSNGGAGLEEHRNSAIDRMRAASLGIKRSAETRAKISAAHKGRIVAESTREKLRAAMTGRKRSEDQIRRTAEKLRGRIGWARGIKIPQERIERIRAANTGRKHSEASKEIMRQKMKGRTFSAETRAKMRAAKIGYVPWNKGKTGVYSPEKIAAMVAAQKAARLARLKCNPPSSLSAAPSSSPSPVSSPPKRASGTLVQLDLFR